MKKTHRALVLAAVAGIGLMATPASAAVNSIAIFPPTQTVNTGALAKWEWSWAGTGSYGTTFYYGDGGSRQYASSSGGAKQSISHAYGPCSTQTYTQRVTTGGANASATTRVLVSGAC